MILINTDLPSTGEFYQWRVYSDGAVTIGDGEHEEQIHEAIEWQTPELDRLVAQTRIDKNVYEWLPEETRNEYVRHRLVEVMAEAIANHMTIQKVADMDEFGVIYEGRV